MMNLDASLQAMVRKISKEKVSLQKLCNKLEQENDRLTRELENAYSTIDELETSNPINKTIDEYDKWLDSDNASLLAEEYANFYSNN